MERNSGFKQPPKRIRTVGQSSMATPSSGDQSQGLQHVAITSGGGDQSQGSQRVAGISVGVQDLEISPTASASIGTRAMDPPQSIEVIGGSSSQAQSTSLSGSTSGGSGKKRKHMTPEERRNRPHIPSKGCLFLIQRSTLQFYKKKSKEYLETKYLHHGVHGLAAVIEDMKVYLSDAVLNDARHHDAPTTEGYGLWFHNQVQQGVYNPTQLYETLHPGAEKTLTTTTMDLEYEKLVWWKNYARQVKANATRMPPWADKLLVGHLSSHGRTGIMWIPRSAEIVCKSGEQFQGAYGKVRQVSIHNFAPIPSHMVFAEKTSKIAHKDKTRARKELSIEALVNPVDHPGMIKFFALSAENMSAFTIWWNGNSLLSVKRIERPFTTIHPSTLLALEGMDIEVRRKIAAFRKQQAWLAWAFMNIIDVLHKSGVLHNDLSPSNILLHFPPELPEDVYIGVCDWGMASWSGEEPLSLNWARDEADLQAKKTARWWIAPEMWYMLPQEVDGVVVSPGTKQTKNTMKSEAYATGKLTRYIYNDASSSTLFKGCDTTRVMLNRVLDGLTKDDPKERWTVAHAVNSMKANPYNLSTPTQCYRYNI